MATGMFGLGLGNEEERARLAQQRNREYAMQLARMSPDEAVSYQGIRGVQAMGEGLGSAVRGLTGNMNADEKMAAARKEIEDRLRGQNMSDPLVAYPVLIEVLHKYGFIDEAMKAAKEFEELKLKRDEQERKVAKDESTAAIAQARLDLQKPGSPLMQAVAKLGELEDKLAALPEGDPKRGPLEKQRDLILNSLAKKNIQVVDAGDRRVVVVDGLPGQSIAKGIDPNRKGGSLASRSGTKAPAGYRWTEKGDLEAIPGGPAALREHVAGAKARTKEAAQANVTDKLRKLAAVYEDLNAIGAVVDAKNSSWRNIIAKARSSKLGKAIEGSLGTEAQQLRARIEAIAPLLINDMRQASEMGARGLDSERELAFYMRATGETGDDITSNIEAIQALNDAYGDGSDITIDYNKRHPSDRRGERQTGSTQRPTGSSDVARPKTKAEYDALPSGTLYVNPKDGKTYRKP